VWEYTYAFFVTYPSDIDPSFYSQLFFAIIDAENLTQDCVGI